LRPNPLQMEQRVLNTRSVKTVGAGGLETWTTVVIDSLHYESHLICTNCGPLGLKGENQEMSTNRGALSDRSWARIVFSDENHESGDVEFDLAKASDALKQQVNRYRVCTCLVAYVLIFIKHIPSCRPNLAYANMLCNKWYEILWNEYNLPRPAKRKKIKLRMMFELFAAESAVFEKFMLPESGLDFEDMLPDENGHLSPFCIEQLTDVIRSLQRCLDFETIHTAWSHSLDHSPATSPHIFQMKTVLSQLHGSELDHLTLAGSVPAPEPPKPPAPPSQGRGQELNPNANQAFFQNMGQLPQTADPFNQTVQGTSAPDAPDSGPWLPAATGQPDAGSQSGRLSPTRHINGHANNPTASVRVQPTMHEGVTRQDCVETASDLAMTRTLRCEVSNRAMTKKIERNTTEHQQLTKLLTDGYDRNREPMHRMASTGKLISAKQAAGACMPNPSDMVNRGFKAEFLRDVVCGKMTMGFHDDYAKIGINPNQWEYEAMPGDVALRGPADFNFNWARLLAFSKSGNDDAQSAKPKSVWANSARVVVSAMKGKFSLMQAYSVPREFVRDLLFMIAWGTIENKIRIPKPIHVVNKHHVNQTTCMLTDNKTFTEVTKPKYIHPTCMFAAEGVPVLLDAFRDPVAFERPNGSTLGDSLMQKRLDHLANQRALPVCSIPEGFERGVPIKECERINGIYFNKHTASEHSSLVVEIGLALANVPGIAGGRYTTVPDTFKVKNTATSQDMQEYNLEVEEERQRSEGAPEPAGNAADGNQMRRDQFETFELGPNQVMAAEPEPDPDESYAEEPEDSPRLPDDGQSSDHNSVQHSVEDPGSEELGIRPAAGAAARAARASVDPSAMVGTLPYEWDQSAMFFSLKMAETLHNDVHAYVDSYRDAYGDVYDEDRDETLAGLPQIALRFPGVTDGKHNSSEEKVSELMPLSVSIPLERSRFCDVAKQIKNARASKSLTEAVHSFAHGRAIAYNDPEVLDQEAEARGIEGGILMKGNLFARSTWERFTLSALDARGMKTSAEAKRVHDQGLCMRLRVRNHRACKNDAEANPHLKGHCTLARPCTFAAQERYKAMLGDVTEEEEHPAQSLSKLKRDMEAKREEAMLDERMDAAPSV
jgi:hypothetical protein